MRIVFGLLLLALAAGCGQDDIKVYRVSKDQETPPSMAPGNMPGGVPPTAPSGIPKITWTTPSGWTEEPASQMRVASFSVKSDDGKQADVSVVPLPGAAGGVLANVNRWRGQVGLTPLSEEEIKKEAQPVEIAGEPAELFAQMGKNPASGDDSGILGVIQERDGMAWFFKMTGDAALVTKEQPSFIAFLKSVKFEPGQMAAMPSSGAPMDGMSLPPGHPDISSMPGMAAGMSSASKPNWQVPSGWKEVAAGQFLVAKYELAGQGGAQAEVNVSSAAGEGGGLVANVNRWRRQLGLSGLSDTEVEQLAKPVEVADGKAMFVDMSGTDAKTGQAARLVAAVVPESGQTWFYKLMGDEMLVEAQKDAFTKFVQTVKY